MTLVGDSERHEIGRQARERVKYESKAGKRRERE